MNAVLEVSNLSIGYGGSSNSGNGSRLAVDDISLDVREGDVLGIVGPNGAGKTTLFRAILGLQQYSGSIRLFGFEAGDNCACAPAPSGDNCACAPAPAASGHSCYCALLPLIGYVPQKITFEQNFPATVHDVVSMGVLSDKKMSKGAALIEQCGCAWNRVYKKIGGADDKVAEALRTVGLESLRDRRIGELSGGELQRVFIAKSLVKDPLLLMLDEPVTSVDVESQAKFYSVIKRLNRDYDITIVWSSHDLDAISKHASKVACMNKRLFFHGDRGEFFSDPALLKTYTESSMQAHMHHHDHGLR